MNEELKLTIGWPSMDGLLKTPHGPSAAESFMKPFSCALLLMLGNPWIAGAVEQWPAPAEHLPPHLALGMSKDQVVQADDQVARSIARDMAIQISDKLFFVVADSPPGLEFWNLMILTFHDDVFASYAFQWSGEQTDKVRNAVDLWFSRDWQAASQFSFTMGDVEDEQALEIECNVYEPSEGNGELVAVIMQGENFIRVAFFDEDLISLRKALHIGEDVEFDE